MALCGVCTHSENGTHWSDCYEQDYPNTDVYTVVGVGVGVDCVVRLHCGL